VAVIYLADKSAWMQAEANTPAAAVFRKLQNGLRLAICPIVEAELLFSARNLADFVASRAVYADLVELETTANAQQRMLGVMEVLARRGQHRSVGIPDLLVAATAEAHGATVLHYDSDFERISEVTGQPHEWIVPRGEGRRRP
jgi:predicted nucleic acid-binding protein